MAGEGIENGIFKFNYDRMIRIGGAIDTEAAVEILIKSEQFEKKNNRNPVQLVINSTGGDPIAALSIFDGMRSFSFPIVTIVEGVAASSAVIVFLLGEERCITLHSSIIIHKPKGRQEGSFTHEEYSLVAEDMRRTEELFIEIFSDAVHQDAKNVRNDLFRGRIFNAQEALEYGLVHKII